MSSHALTAVVSMVLGIVIGVVGLVALGKVLSPDAATAASQLDDNASKPQHYGTR